MGRHAGPKRNPLGRGVMNTATPVGGIATRRLVLRRLRGNDAPDIARLANNMAVVSMTARMPHPYALSDATDFIGRVAANQIDGRVCAVIHTDDGGLMGIISVERKATAGGEDELGYWLGEPFWGHGYATEAARALVERTFLDTHTARLHAGCAVVNAASRRVLQKCGFGFRAVDRGESLALGKTVAVERYSLDRQTWLSLRDPCGINGQDR